MFERSKGRRQSSSCKRSSSLPRNSSRKKLQPKHSVAKRRASDSESGGGRIMRKKSSHKFFYRPTKDEPFAQDDSRLLERVADSMKEIKEPSIAATEMVLEEVLPTQGNVYNDDSATSYVNTTPRAKRSRADR